MIVTSSFSKSITSAFRIKATGITWIAISIVIRLLKMGSSLELVTMMKFSTHVIQSEAFSKEGTTHALRRQDRFQINQEWSDDECNFKYTDSTCLYQRQRIYHFTA